VPPAVYIKNALKLSEDGLGDGTLYGSATGATVDQTNKQFTLTSLTIIADLGADADDLFNGYILYFPSSENVYHVTDWEAATDRPTVFEVPQTIDTGACELRRVLYEGDSLASDPINRSVLGFPSIPWKGRAANVLQRIHAHLPNLVGQGGFEELAAGALPPTEQAKGLWYGDTDWVISSTSPLLGSRMADFTVPGSGDKQISQRLVSKLVKGKTYRVIFKAQAVTGSTALGGIRISITNIRSSSDIDANWDTNPYWDVPVITTTVGWQASPNFIPDFNTDDGRIIVQAIFANRGSATFIKVDEIYLFEVVNVAALLSFKHNWNGSIGSSTTIVRGLRCSRSRTSFGASDNSDLLTITSLDGTGSYLGEFTAAVFPIYEIELPANTNFQYQAGELLLCEKWVQVRAPRLDFDPQRRLYVEERQRAISGIESRTLYNNYRKYEAFYKAVPAADLTIWKGDFLEHHITDGNPFAVQWTGFYDVVTLFRNAKTNFGTPYPLKDLPNIQVDWDEVVE